MEQYRWVIDLIPLSFSSFSLYYFRRDSFWKFAGTIWSLHLGKQKITYDLYLGLFILSIFVFLHTVQLSPIMLVIFPAAVFSNLATFVGLIIYFDTAVMNSV